MIERSGGPPLYSRSAPPLTCQNRGPGRSQPGWDLRSVVGLAVNSATAFLLGFVAVFTPVLIYAAWVTWRIAEAI